MKNIYLFTTLMLLSSLLFSQPWLKNLPQNKTKTELTFFDYQNAFNSYWKPFNVDKGNYTENGVRKKAIGWKQFKRWEYIMERRINPLTGEFPLKSATEIYKEFLSTNSNKSSLATSNWSVLGPNSTTGGYAGIGRINCIAFHPSNNNTYWVGAASGGLWVTTNNGTSWTCLTDNNGVLAVSDIVIPTDYLTSQTIYIATGDKDHWDNSSIGVLKSTNGGISWNTTAISFAISGGKMVNRLLLNPTNNQTLIAATSDGVYKTTDGGSTWNSQLTSTNFIDMEYKPGDFNTLYGSTTNGSIYISTDGGTLWTQAYNNTNARRIELAVSANQPAWIYALAAGSSSGLYAILKSTDSGLNFSQIFDGATKNLLGWASAGDDTDGQGWYDLCLAVSPSNANTVLAGGINTWRSIDGGSTWTIVNHWWGDGVQAVHADKHCLSYRNNGDLFETNDGGIYYSANNGTSWTDKTNGMAISQMYKLGIAQTLTNETITGLQDNGTKLKSGSNWTDVKGGDGMECLIDYTNANIQYGTYVNGQISRTTNHWGSSIAIEPAGAGDGAWVTPFIINPLNPQILYAGYADIWKTTNRGNSWTQISTMNTSAKIRSMAIAASDTLVIYAADPDNIWKTSNGGISWTDITGTLPLGSSDITEIAVKNNDANTLWISLSGYNANKVFQSVDGGNTWTNISTGLPQIPVYSIVQNKQSTSAVQLYAGTEVGVFFKNGANDWVAFNTGLPNVQIGELEIYYASNPQLSKLRAATYGRGLWETPVHFSNVAMSYISGTTLQTNLSKITPGKTKQEIIGIEINTNGILSPLNVTSFSLNTTGTTNPATDIANARLFYTSGSSFDTINQFGSTVNSPNGNFTINGNFTLNEGTNYFWLTYDINANATIGNMVDAQCSSFNVGTIKTPTITNPSGNREIGISYCDANGNNCDEFISNVSAGSINNTSICSTGGYTDYTSLSTNISQGSTLTINITNGHPYAADQCGIWVDWNNNGDFTDDAIIQVSGSPGGGPYSAILNCPQQATLGIKRMRIRIHYDNEITSPCGSAYYGEVEDYSINVIQGCTPPSIQASSLTSSNFTNTAMSVGWTRGSGNKVLVVARAGSAVNSDPVSDSIYNASNIFASGSQIGSGNYVVYNGTGTSVNISNLFSGTAYYFAVYEYNSTGYCYKKPALTGNFSTTGFQYCAAGSTATSYEYISDFSLGSIIQSSGRGNTGYQDFTSQTTSIQIGVNLTATISVTNPYSSDQIIIWADWNQDGDFADAGENVYSSTGTFTSPHTTSAFTPPAGALSGQTRLRIRLHDAGTGPNITPCGNSDYGEVEDYTINVDPPCLPFNITTQPAVTQSACSPSSAMSFTVMVNGTTPITYQWQYNNGGNWNTVINGLPNGAVYSNQNTNTLTVSGINSINTHQYRCLISNCNGINTEYSDIASLIINSTPSAAGIINGLSSVCQGQNNVIYSTALISNAISYIWTLPSGTTGNSSTNSITVNYGTSAVSGNISVKGINSCGEGTASIKFVTVNPLPNAAGSISGLTSVCPGQNNVTYSLPQISNASSYLWTLANGVTGSSSSNTISVNFSNTAVTGNISVKGNNACGDGSSSSRLITVNPLPNAYAGEDLSLCGGDTAILTATGGVNYQWNNGVLQGIPFVPEITRNYIVQVTNQFSCTKSDTVLITVKRKILQLNVLLEGLYSNGYLMNNAQNELGIAQWGNNIADKLLIEIRSSTIPYTTIELFNADLQTNTYVNTVVNCHNTGNYYIVVKNRNHIETWSSSPVSFANDTVNYNFTTTASKAFGNNQKELAPGIYGIYTGDVNQDGLVDGSDMSDAETDNNNFATGYVVSDVNGDGLVDGSDMSIVETSNNNFVSAITP